MSYRELDFSEEKLGEALLEVKSLFDQEFEERGRVMLGRILSESIAVDFREYVRAHRYERSEARRDWRNGYRRRSLLTSFGWLELAIPRCRQESYQPSWLARWQRIQGRVKEMIKAMYIQGVSTRKVGDVLWELCSARVSASTTSNLAKELDAEARAFAQRPLQDDFLFLFLDGVTVKIGYELGSKRYVVLVAYGIRADGSRELIDYRKANSESESAWQAFLLLLQARGLKGRALKLIVIDGAKGLWKAAQKSFPFIPCQLCWVHKLRNLASYCPKRYQRCCTQQAKKIMYAASAALAAQAFRHWKKRWQGKAPNAVACLERDFDKLIPFLELPAPLHPLLRSTNVIERTFREVRRRTRPMGYFRNSASCNRLLYALFVNCNQRWEKLNRQLKVVKQLYHSAA